MSLTPAGAPLPTLCEVCEQKRTGEFIVATGAREMHVFVREGAVAWATDSAEPASFSRMVKRACGIDDASLEEILQECRRSRIPLGETMVSLGLATEQQVHSALETQSRAVVRAIAALEQASFMFLERPAYLAYRADLTFDLTELLTEQTADVAPAVASSEPAPSWFRALRDLPAYSWSCECTGERILSHQRGVHREVPDVTHELEFAGATFVALRTQSHCLVGARFDESRWGWCRIDHGGALAAVVAAFAGGGAVALRSRETALRHGAPRDWECAPANHARSRVVDHAFHLAPGVLAFRVDHTGVQWNVWRRGAEPEELEEYSEFCNQTRAIIQRVAPAQPPINEMRAEQFVVAREERLCMRAREPVGDGHLTVWEIAEAGCPFGLGLAALSVIFRQALHDGRPITDLVPAHQPPDADE
jgi:hypothetical protein